MKKIIKAAAILGIAGVMQSSAATILGGDVAVYRVGEVGSTTALTSGNFAVYVDVFRNTAGTWALNQSIAMPTAVSGSNQILTASGTASSEGYLNLTADGTGIVLGGYNKAVNATTGSSANGLGKYSTERTIGLINVASGAVDTSTKGAWGVPGSSGQNIRSVASQNGTSFYATTDGGIYYGTFGSSGTTPSLIKAGNLRNLEIAGGNLLTGSGSAGAIATGSVGGGIGAASGLPTATFTMTQSFVESAGTSPYGFSLLDLNNDGTSETAYIADSAGGLSKMYFDGSSWTSKGKITGTFGGLEAVYNSTSSSVDIFLTAANGATLYSFNDASGINGALTGSTTTIASAGTNTAFRGVAALAVVPEPSSAMLLIAGSMALIVVRSFRRKQ